MTGSRNVRQRALWFLLVFSGLLVSTGAISGEQVYRPPDPTPPDVVELRKKAAEGDAESLFRLARCYHYGMAGVGEDSKKAFELYSKAVEAGHIVALNNLGWLYLRGEGCATNKVKAVECWRKCSAAGSYWGDYSLNLAYFGGHGVPVDREKGMEYLKKAASKGHLRAIADLGNRYQHGNGTERNLDRAIETYKMGVKMGSAACMVNLAFCYQHGLGVPKSKPKAIELYKRAAELGQPHGMFCLGVSYATGYGVRLDLSKAHYWCGKGAAKGDSSAMYWLADAYKRGRGIKADKEKALSWLQKAADAGHYDAKRDLGWLEKHKETAQHLDEWIKKAEAGNHDALHRLANFYRTGPQQNMKKAAEWTLKSAERGYACCQWRIGNYYARGEGVPQDDKKAIYWLEKAAPKGYPIAYRDLATCYSRGATRDWKKAMEYYKKAIEDSKDVESYAGLGNMYFYARGVPKDTKKAFETYLQGAKEGSDTCMYNVGWCLERGIGTEKDLARARDYYEKAAMRDYPGAKKAFDRVNKKLPPGKEPEPF